MANSRQGNSEYEKKKFTEPTLKFLNRAHSAVRPHLAATTDLPTFLKSAGVLSLGQRKRLVEQAILLIEENYVHLPFKESMHGVDPVQRLRLIKYRLEQSTPSNMGSEYLFHREMLEVFNSVRDLHTNYLLPAPFSNTVAFLPFDIEEYLEDGNRRYIATHFVQGFSHRHLKPGVEITMWNGVPIDRAIEVIADRHAGSNRAARHVRGIDGLTIRPLQRSLPPDELWVLIGYIDLDGNEREMRQDWLVSPLLPDTDGVDTDSVNANAACLGVDLEADLISRTKKMLFAPEIVAEEETVQELSTQKTAAGQEETTSMPGVFRAMSVDTSSGVFGYIRIFTFNVDDPAAFVQEFIRLAELLPQDGLIVDVRGNGGGHIWASEGLLQVLTPAEIDPEPTQFINTPLNLRICERHKSNPTGQIDLGPWVESIRDSLETGAIYSQSFPITTSEFANQWGQRYHGPVVLITDARCYSATDIFAAGFKDHKVGLILGVDDNTGAGGANVWTHGLLQDLLQVPAPPDADSPYEDLPNGANMRVSIRRTLRVGAQAGTPVEDLGIRPDKRYSMTKNDLLDGNKDLISHAAGLLASMPVRQLTVTIVQSDSTLEIEAKTKGITRLDVYIDRRPVGSHDINDGAHTFEFDLPPERKLLELAGFHDGDYVAARKVKL